MSGRFISTLKLAAGLTAVLIHMAALNTPPSFAAAASIISQSYTQAEAAFRRVDRFAETQRLFGEAHRAS
ncbi:MAG TPA: hypothetical protein VKT51_04080 [Candidatus Eremiobacteraceae bacterium]|nr:hypothetical protein [Candidatus Eremiobacteraceae bacterium]